MKPTAIFLNSSPQNAIFSAFDGETIQKLRQNFDLQEKVLLPTDFTKERELLANTEYIFSTWGMPALSEPEIREYFPKLRAVFYAAGSVQGFARPFLGCGIRVFSAWAANAVPVAEYTVAQIILAGKGFFQGLRIQEKEGRSAFRRYCDSFPCNYRTKVGILGVGMIGSLVLKMLRQYDLETLAYDPFTSDEKLTSLGAKRASLEEIFSECQVISNHIANLPSTQKLLRYEHFSRMKPNAAFLNTGRGAQVEEDGLIRALREEPGRTALLDVTWPEPPEPDSPLWSMRNVILTPHIAGSMNNEVARMGAYMAEEAERIQNGQPTRWEVTRSMLETMA